MRAAPALDVRRGQRPRLRRLAIIGGLAFLLVALPAVATRSIWAPGPDPVGDLPAGVEPTPESRPVYLASGEAGGEKWSISAYESDKGRCLDLRIGSQSAGGTCGSGVPESSAIGISQSSGDRSSFVYGETSKRISVLRFALRAGGSISVRPTSPEPALVQRSGLRGDFKFYVARLPTSARLTEVTGEDASGNIVARRPVRSVDRR